MAKQKELDKADDVVDRPDYLSPEWHEYAMGHFQNNETIDGHPNVAGLRRVTELLLGPILNSEVVKVFPVMESNEPGRATVVYRVSVKFSDDTVRTFSDVADVWHGNTDDMFLVHAVATACTRAESRCLRKMLKIRGIAAEELMTTKDSSKIVSDSSTGDRNRCSKDQVNFINAKCKKLDIGVMNFINSGKSGPYGSIWAVEKDIAAKMISKLGLWLKDNSLIDKESLGTYVEGWDTTK